MAIDEKTRAVVNPIYELAAELRTFRLRHITNPTERKLVDLVHEMVLAKADQISMEGVW